MGKKRKVILISLSGIIIVLIVIVYISLLSTRSKFVKYLGRKYPELSFKVSSTKIDIIYGKYYSNVTCLNDGTSFPISKVFKTQDIHEDYIQYKSTTQYNAKIKSIFDGSDIQKDIKSITGGSKIPYDNNDSYEQVDILLISDTDHITDAKKVLKILKEKNIYVKKVIFRYAKDNRVYELWLSSNDYNLTEKEIESKVKRIK